MNNGHGWLGGSPGLPSQTMILHMSGDIVIGGMVRHVARWDCGALRRRVTYYVFSTDDRAGSWGLSILS